MQPESGGLFSQSDVRDWRIAIDGYIEAVDKEFLSSREMSLCKTSLQRAKAWLGETLKAIGTPNPSNKTIEPQAEHGHDRITFVRFDTQVERVKDFRRVIQELISQIQSKEYGLGFQEKGVSLQNLIEAKHWLGWELDRIRNIQEGLDGPMVINDLKLF